MPNQKKIDAVAEMREWMEQCTIAISTDYSGLPVSAMTTLRRALRERGVQFRVVKNRLAHLAAEAAERPGIKAIVEGPTGMAFSNGDPAEPARAISEFIRVTRLPLRVRGGVIGERTLSAQEVAYLATLPSREELIARLAGQLQGPISGLVNVLNAPIAGLAYVLNAPLAGLVRVLQRHAESMKQ